MTSLPIRIECYRTPPAYLRGRDKREAGRATIYFCGDMPEAEREIASFREHACGDGWQFNRADIYSDAAFRADPLKARPIRTIAA